MELPLADKEAQQHIEVTRKTAVEQTRPPSRHKPPAQSLFLEVPETRRQVPPAFSATLAGTESCGGHTPGRHAMDSADVEVTHVRVSRGYVRDSSRLTQDDNQLKRASVNQVCIFGLVFERMRIQTAFSVCETPGTLTVGVRSTRPIIVTFRA